MPSSSCLTLSRSRSNIFRGRSPEGERRQRVFGGQVAGQALVAAGRTVPPDRGVHSLHAYFIRPGDPAVPLVYLVEPVRDGRSFTTRRVTVVQHGKTIFTLSASFQQPEPGGFDHFMPMPQVPGPEELSRPGSGCGGCSGPRRMTSAGTAPSRCGTWGRSASRWSAIRRWRPTATSLWLRADGELPDDPLLHVCLMTYASDMTLLDTVLHADGCRGADRTIVGASLDHAMWFHRPFRADEWLLYAQDSPSATGGRGLARGEVYTTAGQLVVSVVQEGLLRRRTR